MACDSIATTISRMGKEPTTIGPEDPLFLFRWAKEVLFLSIYEMASSDAPTLVGKTLIQVISESVNEPRHRHLFYPRSPSPSPPPLDSENLMDGSGDRPRNYPMLYCTSKILATIYKLCGAIRGTRVGTALGSKKIYLCVSRLIWL